MEYTANILDNSQAITAIVIGLIIICIVVWDTLTKKGEPDPLDAGDCRSCRTVEPYPEPYLTCARFETQDGAAEWVLTCVHTPEELRQWATEYRDDWEFICEEDPADVVNSQYEGVAFLSTGGWE